MKKTSQKHHKNCTVCVYSLQSFVHLTWETNRAVLPDRFKQVYTQATDQPHASEHL